MINDYKQQKNNSLLPWLMWGTAAFFFFFEYFSRVAPSVMAGDLMRAFHASAFSLGSLSAFFYLSYLSMQLPVGILVDRYPIHRLLSGAAFVCALGSVVFMLAHHLFVAEIGRFAIGFGAAFAFVGALKLALLWLPKNRFGLFAGATQALGMLGAAFGEGPLAELTRYIAWRNAMLGMAILFFLLSLLFLFFSYNSKNSQATSPPTTYHLKNFQLILKNRQTWLNAFYIGLLYAPTAAFAELWGVSFLHQAHHLSLSQSSFAIGLIFIGWGIGGPICGGYSDYIGRRRPFMFVSSVCSLLFLCVILITHNLPSYWIYLLMFFYGFTNTAVVVSYAVASEINPITASGTSLGLANVASVIIGAALQPLIGKILDWTWQGTMLNGIRFFNLHDYRIALSTLPICSLLSIFFLFFLKETYCKNISRGC